MPDNVPQDMAGVLAMIKQFHAVYSPSPTNFGLSPTDATKLGVLVGKVEAAIDDEAASKSAFEAAKAARREAFQNLVAEYRAQRREAKADRTMTAANRAALGVDEPDSNPTATPAPATHPVLEVDTAERLLHIIEFYDETANNTGSRAKPAGAASCEIRCAVTAVGAAAPSVPGSFFYHSDDSASPCEVAHDAADAGKTAHYIGRWKTRTGLTGPWSATVSATITG